MQSEVVPAMVSGGGVGTQEKEKKLEHRSACPPTPASTWFQNGAFADAGGRGEVAHEAGQLH